jgi:hypothetical protein
MRTSAILATLFLVLAVPAADVESRVLTHYVPQDLLEKAVRTEGWTEVTLNIKGGVLKGDTIRIWTGGSIDRGNGDHPGQNVNGPSGLNEAEIAKTGVDVKKLVLSQHSKDAFALLVKTDVAGVQKCPAPGKPLEIKLTKDKERLWIGFNDEKGRYMDNHLGKGRRHESDPLWMRVEVVRTIVD